MDWSLISVVFVLDLVVFGFGYLLGRRSTAADNNRLRVELKLLNEAYLGTTAELHEANKARINLVAKLERLAKGPARGANGRFLKRKK